MYRHIIPVLIIVLAIAGCSVPGGGGGSGDAAPAPATNTAPTVTITPPGQGALSEDVALIGSATDDGLPGIGLSYSWTKLDGAGTVTFASTTAATTSARFSALGTYHLRLDVSDGALSNSSTVAIEVINPIVTVAGTDFDVRVGHSASPAFATTTTTTVNLYKSTYYPAAGGQPAYTSKQKYTYTYAAETVSGVPCVRVQGAWEKRRWEGSPAAINGGYTVAHDLAIAKATDGTTRTLRARATLVDWLGVTQTDTSLDLTSALPVFLPSLSAASPPIVYDSLNPSGGASGKYRVDATVADTPNGKGAGYRGDLPIISEWWALDGSGIPVDNPFNAWTYLKVGEGIVDLDGFGLVASAPN